MTVAALITDHLKKLAFPSAVKESPIQIADLNLGIISIQRRPIDFCFCGVPGALRFSADQHSIVQKTSERKTRHLYSGSGEYLKGLATIFLPKAIPF